MLGVEHDMALAVLRKRRTTTILLLGYVLILVLLLILVQTNVIALNFLAPEQPKPAKIVLGKLFPYDCLRPYYTNQSTPPNCLGEWDAFRFTINSTNGVSVYISPYSTFNHFFTHYYTYYSGQVMSVHLNITLPPGTYMFLFINLGLLPSNYTVIQPITATLITS